MSLDLFTTGANAATFSACRTWRYRLWRVWGAGPMLAVCGLNPSTADETNDDPTIRRCVGFGKQWGFGSLYMVNAFAFRSTEPTGLLAVADPVGELNDSALAEVASTAQRFVFAWGRHEALKNILPPRALKVRALVLAAARGEVGSFGHNGDGSPKHPLYLPKATFFVPEVHSSPA